MDSWELLLSFHHQSSLAGCTWALVGAEMVAWSIPWLSLSKKGILDALGTEGKSSTVPPASSEGVSGVASSVPPQGTPVPVAQSQGQHGPG